MTIHYAHLGSEAGPFVFIRLSDTIEQSKHDIQAWAKKLSSENFSNAPLVVHNHDKNNNEIITTFPPEFKSRSVIGSFTGAGAGLATIEVAEIPARR